MLSFFLYVQLFLFIQRDDSNSLSALEIPSRNRLDHFQNCCCAAALALGTSGDRRVAEQLALPPTRLWSEGVWGHWKHTRTQESRLSHAARAACRRTARRTRMTRALPLDTATASASVTSMISTTRSISRHTSFELVLRFQNYAVLVEFY